MNEERDKTVNTVDRGLKGQPAKGADFRSICGEPDEFLFSTRREELLFWQAAVIACLHAGRKAGRAVKIADNLLVARRESFLKVLEDEEVDDLSVPGEV
jgi:hypothetical protein